MRDNLTGDPVPPLDDFTTANSVDVPFRPGAPGVIDLAELRERLVAKAPNVGDGAASRNEFALQMLRFPYRQVFGDPTISRAMRFYDLDRFQVTRSALIERWQQRTVDRTT